MQIGSLLRPSLFVRGDLLLGQRLEVHAVGPYTFVAMVSIFSLIGIVVGIEELELGRLLAGGHDGLGQFDRALAALGPVVGHDGRLGPGLLGRLAGEFHLGLGVSVGKLVDRHDDRHAEHPGDLDVP